MNTRLMAVFTFLTAFVLGSCSDEPAPTTPVDDVDSVAPVLAAAGAAGDRRVTGGVVTSTNATTGNQVLTFVRSPKGALREFGAYSTGGVGTGGGLSNQGAVSLTRNARWLLVVNAGSDDVSLFQVKPELKLVDRVPSNGTQPISVAVYRRLVYVLNGAGDENISGYLIRDGTLVPIPGAVYPLSEPRVGSAQVGFSPNGRKVVVTERATNRILVFRVQRDGTLDTPRVEDAAGETPFGFGFSRTGALVVSEAFGGAEGASVLSSYHLTRDGGLSAVTPLAATTQTAACWVAITPSGRYAFTTNTGSGTISSFKLSRRGDLELIDAAAAGEAGRSPLDMGISRNGRFLTVLNSGVNSLATYYISPNGGLESVEGGTYPGLPDGATGLVAF